MSKAARARGTVIKRGDKYTVVLDFGRDEAGKRIRQWHSGFLSQNEAERARTQLLGSVDSQTYVAPTKVTVRKFVEELWLPALESLVVAGKLKPSTVANYRNLVNAYVLPKLGRVVLRDLTLDHLLRLYTLLQTSGARRNGRGLSRTTVHHVHVCLHRMLKDARKRGLIARNVAEDAAEYAPRPSRGAVDESRLWSTSQVDQFLESVRCDRLEAMWVLFAYTGMRRGEVAGLLWQDVDLEGSSITVRRARVVINHEVVLSTTKSDRERTVGIDSERVRALRAHRARQAADRLAWGPEYRGTDLVFTWEDGSPLHPDLITRTFKRLAMRAGLPPLVVHGLRHSNASALHEAGVDAKTISERLGHASITTTMDIYTHIARDHDKQAAEQLADLFRRHRQAE